MIGENARTVPSSQGPLRAQAHSAAETAIYKTDNIGEQVTRNPVHGKVEEPIRHEVDAKVEAREEFFNRERTGEGRIQTTAAGMAGEGIGKVDRALGKIVGKPERPEQDVMDIGAPDQPGAPPP
jgi:hypothetical protein